MRGMATLKEHVTGNVKFQFYREGELYYKTETGLVFPVPVSETGNATFLAEDKALLFMRYIRKYLEEIEKEKRFQDQRSHESNLP
jgi:hypothetical protein